MLRIGDPLPDVVIETTRGRVDLRRFQGAGWLLLFGYPADFTPVCSTELAAAAERFPAFAERATCLLAIGTSDVEAHRSWVDRIEASFGCRVPFPVAADHGGDLAAKLGFFHPADPARPSRVTYLVSPQRTVSAVVAYPTSVGRGWDELVRLCDAVRLRETYGLSAPAGWQRGEPALIPSALSNHEADQRWRGWWSMPDGRRMVEVPRRPTTSIGKPKEDEMTETARPPLPHDYLTPVPAFTVTSDDMVDGKPLDNDFVADARLGLDGGNTSPHLCWEGFPPETRSFAVTMYDPDAPTGSGFWHWVLFDIPTSVTELPTGAGSGDKPGLPEAVVHARNDAGGPEYIGAGPPPGHGPHRYVFTVHALDVDSLGLDESASPAYVGFNLGAHALARATLIPTYEVAG